MIFFHREQIWLRTEVIYDLLTVISFNQKSQNDVLLSNPITLGYHYQ